MDSINILPTNCPICGFEDIGETYRENDCERYYIGLKCLCCGAVWVNKFAYVETEVYTKEQWEG